MIFLRRITHHLFRQGLSEELLESKKVDKWLVVGHNIEISFLRHLQQDKAFSIGAEHVMQKRLDHILMFLRCALILEKHA